LARVLEKEIDMQRTLERHREALMERIDLNLLEAYNQLADRLSGQISFDSMKDFLWVNGYRDTNEEHLTAIFRRFDSDGDRSMSYSDFVAAVVAKQAERRTETVKMRNESPRYQSYTHVTAGSSRDFIANSPEIKLKT
jgi:Ca2+-binding EF-hand superfamily protein